MRNADCFSRPFAVPFRWFHIGTEGFRHNVRVGDTFVLERDNGTAISSSNSGLAHFEPKSNEVTVTTPASLMVATASPLMPIRIPPALKAPLEIASSLLLAKFEV